MSSDDPLLERIKDLLVEQTGTRRSKLTPDTRLAEDCGVDGDDAGELMEAFFREFRVDPTGFDFDRHFGPEAGATPLTFIPGFLRGGRSPFVPIALEDLYQSARSGRWCRPQTSMPRVRPADTIADAHDRRP